MYGIFTYIWLTFMANVGKYTSLMDANPKTVNVRQAKQLRFGVSFFSAPGAAAGDLGYSISLGITLWLFVVGCWLIENRWSMLFFF